MEISFGNIAANNGWAMALVGFITVIVALAVLATLISLMPKIIVVIDAISPSKLFGKKDHAAPVAKAQPAKVKAVTQNLTVLDVTALAAEYGQYINELNASFELKDLYALAKEKDLEHPHLSITALQEAGKIVPEADGLFKWNA